MGQSEMMANKAEHDAWTRRIDPYRACPNELSDPGHVVWRIVEARRDRASLPWVVPAPLADGSAGELTALLLDAFWYSGTSSVLLKCSSSHSRDMLVCVPWAGGPFTVSREWLEDVAKGLFFVGLLPKYPGKGLILGVRKGLLSKAEEFKWPRRRSNFSSGAHWKEWARKSTL